MDYIDKDEKELLESFERNEWVSVSDSKKAEIEAAARNNTKKKKNKRINIRLTEKDNNDIQIKAMEEGDTLSNIDIKHNP